MRWKSSTGTLKNAIPVIGVSLLLIGNEIISLAVLSALACMGVVALFSAIAEVGNW